VGDVGARPVLAALADLVVRVECADIGDGHDVDVPADLPR
jgi:CTP:molybdopterin cytidylyltransferase MocA